MDFFDGKTMKRDYKIDTEVSAALLCAAVAIQNSYTIHWDYINRFQCNCFRCVHKIDINQAIGKCVHTLARVYTQNYCQWQNSVVIIFN